MKPNTICAAALLCTLPAICQQAPPATNTVPIYRVTVVERNVQAVNYQYRSGPTKIDFRGTVLLSNARGEATVDSRRGRTEIDAKFEHLAAPTRFGREYLTYVLWAISPEGAPHNLGELVPNASDGAKLHVTTGLQAFGLIVTAEPYSAVRQPSDVVVLENEVRPDTVGQAQPIQAKYELMPRGHYTWNVQQSLESAAANAPKVSMAEYEALIELYQAQNALGIARAANAETYAPGTIAQAERLLNEAQRLQAGKFDRSLVVQNARAAAQTAEDARVIAERRKQDEQVALAQKEAAAAQQAKTQAEAETQRALARASVAQAQADSERAARERAEAEAALARQRAAQAGADRMQTESPQNVSPQPMAQSQSQTRMRLLEQLNGIMATRDTSRGLVVTVADLEFTGTGLRPMAAQQVDRIANILAANHGLRLEVEGNTDSAATTVLSQRRADAVRDALVRGGLAAALVAARGLGNTRPLVSNATETGRIQNRRVEIVISGDPIGTLPFWDRTYSVAPR